MASAISSLLHELIAEPNPLSLCIGTSRRGMFILRKTLFEENLEAISGEFRGLGLDREVAEFFRHGGEKWQPESSVRDSSCRGSGIEPGSGKEGKARRDRAQCDESEV